MKKFAFLGIVLFLTAIGAAAGVGAPEAKCDEPACTINSYDLEYGRVGPTYVPSKVSLRPGANITFVNLGKDAHTATQGVSPLYGGKLGERLFDTGLIQPGKKVAIKIDKVGEYPYYCGIHPWMNGTIIVAGEPVPTKPATQPEPAPAPQPAPIPEPVPQPQPAPVPQQPMQQPMQAPPVMQPEPQQPIPAPALQPVPQQPVPLPAEPAKQEPQQPIKPERAKPSSPQPEPESIARAVSSQPDLRMILGGAVVVMIGALAFIALRKR